MSDNLPAGRELDRLIAEKVIGLWVYHYDKDYAENCYYTLLEGLNPVIAWPFRAGERKTEAEAWDDVPRYSTDMAAAWQVVEAVPARLTSLGVAGDYTGWRAVFVRQDGTELRRADATALTAPHAICLAALKALGAKS